MEPFKALTLLAAAGVVSLVGAGAGGFYAGYSAGRGNLDEIKAQIANAPMAVTTGSGGAVSLKPVLEDIRALSKQVEALAASKSAPIPTDGSNTSAKPILDEIKALSRQIDGLKSQTVASAAQAPASAPQAADYGDDFKDLRDQIRALNAKIEKQEPKAPKALVDEIRSLSASVQTQEPNTRRAIADEVRSAVNTLQNAEPKAPKALVEEIRAISASLRAQEQRPQASVIDQVKILTASIESLKGRIPENLAEEVEGVSAQVKAVSDRTNAPASNGRCEATTANELVQLRQLVTSAAEQMGRCQAQFAAVSPAAQSQAPAASPPIASPVALSTSTSHGEPATVVFYDNVMLRKDQEKQYDEIGVRLALQSIAPRQVRVAVNRQGFGLAFGERKVFRSQDVECELNLMETNLNESQARVSISCKR